MMKLAGGFIVRFWIIGILVFFSGILQAQTYLDATVEDTFVVKRCALPLVLINETPEAGFSAQWEQYKGFGYVKGSTTNDSLVIEDFITDTCVLIYTIRYGSIIFSKDTLSFIKDTSVECQGMLLDRSSIPFPANCDDTITLAPSLDTTLYTHYYWYGTNVEFLTPDTATVAKFVVRVAGAYSVGVLVGTHYNAYGVVDVHYDTATCIPPPIAFAGGDTTITYCDVLEFKMCANAPAVDETGEWWVDSPGLHFNQQLHNSAIVDVSPGVYTLVWKVRNSTKISRDTMVLTVLPTELCPAVSVGTDVNVFCGDTIILSGSQPGTNETGKWYATFGNVTFIDDTNPTTKAVVHNGGLQILKWIVSSPLQLNSRADYMNIQSVCLNTIEGTVKRWAGLQNHGSVFLLQKNGIAPVQIKKTPIINGTFKFYNMANGTYYLYAVPYEDIEQSQTDEDYLPTFYVNKVSFNQANSVNIFGNTFGIDIKLAPKPSSFASNALKVLVSNNNSIMSDLPLLLFDSKNKLVSWAMLGENQARFEKIPDESYWVEIPYHEEGYKRSPIVQLSGNQEKILDLTNQTEDVVSESSKVSAFPNPFNDRLRVTLPEMNNKSVISILNFTTGVELLSLTTEEVSDVEINTESIDSGVYLLKIESNNAQEILLINKFK